MQVVSAEYLQLLVLEIARYSCSKKRFWLGTFYYFVLILTLQSRQTRFIIKVYFSIHIKAPLTK